MQLNVAPQFKYQKVKLSLSESLAFFFLSRHWEKNSPSGSLPLGNEAVRKCNYRPQQYLRKGNVFTTVCQEFCPHGGGGGVVHLPLGRHSPGQTPPLPQTATAAYGTHPTGMHSCVFSRVCLSVCLLTEGFPSDNYNDALSLTIQGPYLRPVTPLPL